MKDKNKLLPLQYSASRSDKRLSGTSVFAILACASLIVYWSNRNGSPASTSADGTHDSFYNAGKLCAQADVLYPAKHVALDDQMDALYRTDAFQLDAFEKLGGAVRVPSESYDGLLPVGQDARWLIFGNLNEYLQSAFPAVYGTLNVTNINTYNLVFHWQGSDTSLKPLLLTAHQDVVPVEPATVSDWIQPPYSGFYDGEWIWGRGSCDDKSGLISILVAVNALLSTGFQPTRTVVLAFGIDEESSGLEGAGRIAEYLEKTYGIDGFAMLVDEGGVYMQVSPDVVFAAPNTAEKGYLDVTMEVSTKGGHSSVPPRHTSIGMLSGLITYLEANPYETTLLRNSTTFAFCQCLALYNPSFPDELRELVKEALESDKALSQLQQKLIDFDPSFAAILGTTQAVDIIHGGVKVNALPEKASAIVNHRIAADSSVSILQEHITRILTPVAEKYNISLHAFGNNVNTDLELASTAGQLTLSDAFGTALEPAPETPTGLDSGPWRLLSGTIKATVLTSFRSNISTVAVSPSLAIGNTDTKSYWNLTRHIFRYSHIGIDDAYNGAHTINEALHADGLIESIRFITKLILNFDETGEF